MASTVKRAGAVRDTSSSVIAKYRQLSGLSQVELARSLGVSQPLVSSWECGRVTPSIVDIVSIETALNTEPGEMLFQIGYPKYANNPNSEKL
jgi:transcriptional regulator with XRE-family HTH domain